MVWKYRFGVARTGCFTKIHDHVYYEVAEGRGVTRVMGLESV